MLFHSSFEFWNSCQISLRLTYIVLILCVFQNVFILQISSLKRVLQQTAYNKVGWISLLWGVEGIKTWVYRVGCPNSNHSPISHSWFYVCTSIYHTKFWLTNFPNKNGRLPWCYNTCSYRRSSYMRKSWFRITGPSFRKRCKRKRWSWYIQIIIS